MRLTDHISLIGSGRMGFSLTHPLDSHVYLVHDRNEAVIIDAGAGVDHRPILREIDAFGVPRAAIRRLLLTHAHPDHAGGAHVLHEALGIEVWASEAVGTWLRDSDGASAGFTRLTAPGGYPEGYSLAPCPIAGSLREGDRITVGRLEVEVIETPGHCGGHLSFALHRPGGIDLFSGDAIFARGRILLQDLPDCSVSASCESIRRLARLRPDGLYPGHGEVAITGGVNHISSALEAIGGALPPPQLA